MINFLFLCLFPFLILAVFIKTGCSHALVNRCSWPAAFHFSSGKQRQESLKMWRGGFKQFVCFYYKEMKDKKGSNLLPIFLFVSMSCDYLCHRGDMKNSLAWLTQPSLRRHFEPLWLVYQGPHMLPFFPRKTSQDGAV